MTISEAVAERPTARLQAPAFAVAWWRPAALTVFATWLVLVGSHHEPWFDEVQAWLLARDNDLWPLLAQKVRYEGTPGLWHLILWLLIHAGLPFRYFFLIPTAFAVAGAAVVLWRAPFSVPLRLALLASYFFGYQFSVIARSYCLDLLLVPLAASFFAARTERPLRYALILGLIANANGHGFLAAGILGVELLWQLWRAGKLLRPSSLAALTVAAGLGLFALWAAWQPADNNFLLPEFRRNALVSFLVLVCNAFVDRIAVWNGAQPYLIEVLAGFGISVAAQRPIVRLFMAGTNRSLAVALMLALVSFSLIVYSAPWHAGLFFLFWLFLLWINWNTPVSDSVRRGAAVSLAMICLLQAVETVSAGLWDVNNAFSAGAPAARAVVAFREDHPGSRIAAFGYKAFEVQPWFPGNLFANYHHAAPNPSYIRWDLKEEWSPRVTAPAWQQVLASHPDLIVASTIDRGRRFDPMPQACRAGYGVRDKFPAMMIWRGAEFEDETLILFQRGAAKGCEPLKANTPT